MGITLQEIVLTSWKMQVVTKMSEQAPIIQSKHMYSLRFCICICIYLHPCCHI